MNEFTIDYFVTCRGCGEQRAQDRHVLCKECHALAVELLEQTEWGRAVLALDAVAFAREAG